VIHSIRFRILLSFAIVILVTIGTVFFFINQATMAQIRQFGERIEQTGNSRIIMELSSYYHRYGTWEGIQPTVARWGDVQEKRIIITDADGVVVADSDEELLGESYESDTAGVLNVIQGPPWSMNTPGKIYINSENPSAVDFNSQSLLYKAIGRFFLWGGLLAVIIALVITFVLSRRILAPVKALTNTARELGKGDFSKRVQVNDKGEIGELAYAFNSMAGNLEHAEKLRRNMVADVAHELRTPLSNVRGYLEAVQEGVLKPSKSVIDSLNEEAMLLSRMVDDLQELSLADAGALKMDFHSEYIINLIKQGVSLIAHQAKLKNISVILDLPAVITPINMDAHRIGQVLRNLLENAVIHTPGGGSITVKAMREENHVKVIVADTGEGIAEEDLPYVFERFYRADRSRTRATGGSGLGLTISKSLVEAHGGTMEVQSEQGKGSTFIFYLPVSL